MIIRGKGVDYNKVRSIIESVSNSDWDGNLIVHADAKPVGSSKNPNYGFQGRIVSRTSRDRCARVSWQGRRTNAACWHAWRDAIRAVLTAYPHAVVTTAQARYDGLEGFEDTYPSTSHINIGSMMQPAYMPDLCSCGDDEG